MRNLCKFLVLLLLVAALPLRGYAALAGDLCADHHGGAAAAHADHHDQGSHHGHKGTRDGTSSGSSSCSHSVGASVASDVKQINLAVGSADRIPFVDRRKPGYVPDHPERPPLVS